MGLFRLAWRGALRPGRFWPAACGVFLLALSVLYAMGGVREVGALRDAGAREAAAHAGRIVVIPRYAPSTGLRQSFRTLQGLAEQARGVDGVGWVDQAAQFLRMDAPGGPVHFAAVEPDPRWDGVEGAPFEVVRTPGAVARGHALGEYPEGTALAATGFPMTVAQVLEEAHTSADRTVYMSRETADALLRHLEGAPGAEGMEKEYEQSLFVTAAPGEDPMEVGTRILRGVKNVYLFDGRAFFAGAAGGMAAAGRAAAWLRAGLPAALVVGLTALFGVSSVGRRRELAVLRALGAPASSVRRLLLLENALPGLAGGAAASGAYAAWALMGGRAALPTASEAMAALLAAAAGSLAAAWIPSAYLTRRDPARYMRG